jgi:NitT/TauT family transport system substrate-binding protein
MRTRALVPVCLAAALGLCVSGCDAAVPAESMRMTIGYTAIGAAYSDLYVCQDQGIFRKNGLDVRLKLLNSTSQLVAALVSNSVQIGAGAARSTAAGAMNLKGVDLRYIALPIPRYYLEMWGKPSIHSLQDVKGKKVGLSSPGSLGDASVDAMLDHEGWTAHDIKKTFLKSTPVEVTALEKGAVDAIVTQPPTGTQTRAKGFHKIMDFTGYPAVANAYTTKKEYVDKNTKAVRAFVKSEVECLAILHRDRKAAVASILKHSGNSDKALAEYSYDFFEPLWARTPTVDPGLVSEAFSAAASHGAGKKPANTAQYVDNSFVDKLKSSGFISGLYPKAKG